MAYTVAPRSRAHEQDQVTCTDLLQRKAQAPVIAHRAVQRCGSRGHAIAPVVVNVCRSQRQAGELTQQVSFFVCQRAAAQYAHRIWLRSEEGPQRVRHVGQSLSPAHRHKFAILAEQGLSQAVRVTQVIQGGEPLLADGAVGHGAFLGRCRLDGQVVLDL